MSAVLIWLIATGVILGVLFRPRQWPEAIWASLGAILLIAAGLLPVEDAIAAIGRGSDVYLFLIGMMLLAELARLEGVFDWLAGLAVRAAQGSQTRLFTLIYAVGIAVTVFLSNDATAVVLTPAVYAAVKKARTSALPYLFICAFIANAASFVLPISNPANLVVYGKTLPPLFPWLRTFLLPSLCSIGATYLVLRWLARKELEVPLAGDAAAVRLSRDGWLALWGVVLTGFVLIAASALGLELGLPTLVTALLSVLLATRARIMALTAVAKGVSWAVLPLVGGLFILVEALNHTGARDGIGNLLSHCSRMPTLIGSLAASFGVAGLSNLMNNLPSGLLTGSVLQELPVPGYLRDSVLIGIDLGPNLSVTGSLATVLWLIALRREGIEISGWHFLKMGFIVMPPALLLATIAVWWMAA
ncbi:arsenic transporter [Bryobacter aggregatus]|uniref:arsenic transporter n=1 Tax=Bryobacter aggregatus TaxID=360054 RepID=UPI0004E0E7C3|nr:arsenic transporter [Bryobacter aggregatus]